MQRAPILHRLRPRGASPAPCAVLTAALLIVGLGGAGAMPQGGDDDAEGAGRRMRAAQRPLGEDLAFDAAGWKRRLSQADLALREAAYGDLVAVARTEPAARRALAVWASSTAEPELAWTARLALRELERAPRCGWQAMGPDGHSPLVGADDLTERLRWFDEFFEGAFDGGGGLSLARPRRLTLPHQGGVVRESRAYSVEVRPDGVCLRVTEDGKTREYAAPCLDRILEENPHLADEIPGLADMTLQPFGSGTSLRWMDGPVRLRIDPQGWRGTLAPDRARPEGAVPTAILGIECGAPTPEERAACKVAPDCGVLVRRVVGGTIADEVGLRRGDIVVAIDGRAICSPEEISCLMAERAPDAALTVEVVDCRGGRRVATWHPDAGD
ncbi:MAG: PDZ domain-containing protein [Planctomycetota bacterium]|nr:PDZ domain-containing protein [Planctomycetota bacterium]